MTGPFHRWGGLLVLTACGGSAPTPPPPAAPTLATIDSSRHAYSAVSVQRTRTMSDGTPEASTSGALRWEFTLGRDTGHPETLLLLVGPVRSATGQLFGATDPPLEGTEFHRPLSRAARDTVTIEPAAANPAGTADHISAIFHRVVPTLPGAGISPGSAWVDTMFVTRRVGDAVLGFEAITRHQASAWSDTLPGATMRVDWDRDITLRGEGQSLGQSFTVEGGGTGHGWHQFAASGVYLGSVARDSTVVELLLGTLGMVVTLEQVEIDSIAIRKRS